ncbi:MAG: lantibiotic biosynthesis protein, partial [Acidimicrobiaceae bacterium]|nr:lantibiotic biosynthesis protein [Acidimicrobiaceae bacterium]
RFLAALQSQGNWAGLSWSWGQLSRAPFLPRLRAGRLVLARASWTLTREQIVAFTSDRTSRESVALWRQRYAVPRWVALADFDNELVLDLDSASSVELFTQSVRGRIDAQVVELFPPPDQLCATGAGGRYVHEFVLPMQRVAPTATATPRRATPIDMAFPRRFPPGSEWLYLKLYTGTATADDVLRTAVGPLVRAALESGAADRWFFLRYGDPDHHLRVRLHGDPSRLRAEVEPLVDIHLREALADGRIWRVGYDTYERELERYGGPAGMEPCEAIFHADSDAALGIIELLEGDGGLDARWRLVLAGTDRLLRDFGFDLVARRDWARARRAAYLTEFPGGQALEKQLGQRWRAQAPTLEPLIDWTGDAEHPHAPGLELLAARSDAIAPIASDLRGHARELTVSIDDIVASLAHLSAIRLLRSGARAQELVVNDLLGRLYHRRLARVGPP